MDSEIKMLWKKYIEFGVEPDKDAIKSQWEKYIRKRQQLFNKYAIARDKLLGL